MIVPCVTVSTVVSDVAGVQAVSETTIIVADSAIAVFSLTVMSVARHRLRHHIGVADEP